jgi:hypothetical protein
MQSNLNIWVTFILVYLYCICYRLVIVTFCLLSPHATFCFLIVSCCVHVCWLCCCWWQSFFGFHINKEFEFKVKVVFFFFFLCLRAGRCLGLWCRKQTQKNLGLEEILKKIRMQMFTKWRNFSNGSLTQCAKIKIINLQIWCSFIKQRVICWQIWDKV